MSFVCLHRNSPCVAQAGLELLDSNDVLTSARPNCIGQRFPAEHFCNCSSSSSSSPPPVSSPLSSVQVWVDSLRKVRWDQGITMQPVPSFWLYSSEDWAQAARFMLNITPAPNYFYVCMTKSGNWTHVFAQLTSINIKYDNPITESTKQKERIEILIKALFWW